MSNVTQKFMYVFSPEASKIMTEHGYTLVKQDERNRVYIYVYDKEKTDALKPNVSYILSDTLTF